MKWITPVLSLVLAAAVARADDIPPLPVPDQSGLAPVDGVAIWYAVFDRGGPAPVILLHGGLGDSGAWGAQVPALALRHEVIVVDSRGHGRSEAGEEALGYDLMASDVLALMDHLGIGRAAIVGWSDGGIIGLDIAIHHPERLTKLYAYGANYNVHGLADGVLSEPGEDAEALERAVMHMWMTEPDFTPAQLGRIRVPTMIADGENDTVIRREHTEELARLIPGARLEILPQVGHAGLWEDPEAFNASVSAFLDGE